ncbi:hypothetical protein ASB62_05555 [Chlorobium limicola]|uniref:Glycosyltransferase 2-like domain-containing protein n=2 Tax=Chlorobium limicola TaxID=1092 RepID=A0A101JKV2_CHLLI|nr:hypothetical protein ASB62_05555 [Chlorobium limicola]
MPIYNGSAHLREAIESVLNQNFSDFEFLIIDDGSTDGSREIVNSYDDPRIELRLSPKNRGIAKTLNDGIKLAKGRYIARMDADDICMPQRLQRQFDFMETYSHIGLVGSGVMKIKQNRVNKIVSWPETDAEIKIDLLFQNPFFHPSVMVRCDLLKKTGYNLQLPYAQDYGLWVELAHLTDFANLPDALIKYRVHEGQVTKTKGSQQAAMARKVRENYLCTIFHDVNKNDLDIHNAIAERDRSADLFQSARWLESLDRRNNISRKFPVDTFRTMIARKWWNCCKNNRQNGINIWHAYKSSYLSDIHTEAPQHIVRYLLKSLFR